MKSYKLVSVGVSMWGWLFAFMGTIVNAEIPIESSVQMSLAYSPRSSSKSSVNLLNTRELIALMGLSGGSLVCVGDASDRFGSWSLKHVLSPKTKDGTEIQTDLSEYIKIEVLGLSDVGTWKTPSAIPPKVTVALGRIISNRQVKVSFAPKPDLVCEFWGSMLVSYNVVQEADAYRETWFPGAVSIKLTGIWAASENGDDAAASLTLTMGAFRRNTRNGATAIPSGMVRIPTGTYEIGDSFEEFQDAPVTSITLSDYFVSKNDTTKAQWDGVRVWASNYGYTDLSEGGATAINHPVHTVSWYDVIKWCNAASEKDGLTPCYSVGGHIFRTGVSDSVVCNWSANGYRLPTEAEWEVAARGGLVRKRFPFGDTISHSQANYRASSDFSYDLSGVVNDYHPSYAVGDGAYTNPVGVFAANGFGLYDVAGNVTQWCWDWYGLPYVSTVNPKGVTSGTIRVLRGGFWKESALLARTAYRNWETPYTANYAIGFRTVRSRP